MFINTQRGIAAPALIGVVVLLALLGGVYYLYSAPAEAPEDVMMEDEKKMEGDEMMEKDGDAMMEEGDAMEKKDDAMMKDEGSMMETGDGEMGGFMMYAGGMLAGTEQAPLLDFNSTDYEEALKSDKLVVLYFYANWCPICKAEFPKMEQAFNELQNENVIGFRVNFNDNQTDSAEKALASEHGVAYQHTKVFVKNGERILKSPETWEKSRYLSEIADNS